MAAQSGYDVLLVDVAPQALERGVSQIGKGLERLVSKGKLAAEERDQALSRLSSHGELAALDRADLVVEAVVEKLEVKRSVFGELDRICPPHTILSSNTSSISITKIAASHHGPARSSACTS